MERIIKVKLEQDTIRLYGTDFLVDKAKLAKDGRYELKAFGDAYLVEWEAVGSKQNRKNKQKD